MIKFKSQGLYIPTLWNIGILQYKQAKLPIHLQHNVPGTTRLHKVYVFNSRTTFPLLCLKEKYFWSKFIFFKDLRFQKIFIQHSAVVWELPMFAQTYLQLPLWQLGAGNVYLLVLSSWKVNFAENPIAIMGL